MPIRFRKSFLDNFSKEDMRKIKNYRIVSISTAIFCIILNIIVYITVTYFGFLYWGTEGYYYDYFERLYWIENSYILNWIVIYLASFSIFLHIYLNVFTINPQLKKVRLRKDINLKKTESEIKEYKKLVRLRIFFQLLLILTIILELNYYPRNTELFYPFISCDSDTGICYITKDVLFPFLFGMTSFLIIIISTYAIIIYVNLKEAIFIKRILKPNAFKQEKKALAADAKIQRKGLTIEERRQLKIEQLRKNYERKVEEKQEKRKQKFVNMYHREQFGKKGFKTLKKDQKIKQNVQPKKKKDDFDYT